MTFSWRRQWAFWRDAECGLPLGFIAALLALRVLFLFRHGVDSDEAQHLHVIYAWLNGGVPYRDIFDNHTPLFYWLFLPLARLAGETPEIVLLARLAQIPISFGVLGIFYVLARRLSDRVSALWALALVLALADWSLKSLEFRPDVLWTALWFAALLVLVRAPGGRTFFGAGFLLGAALMASVKTSFLLAALGLGWAGAWALSREFRELYTPQRIAACAGAGALGFAVVPGIFLGWFASRHALAAMKYCLFTVNQPDAPTAWRVAIFAAGLPLALGLAWRMRDVGHGPRTAVFLAAAFYALLVIGFSPTLKKQTFLPVYPLLILAAVNGVRSTRSRWMPGLGSTACVALLAHQVAEGAPWRDGQADQRALLRDTLALARPGDTLLDLKGETIFRKRPIYLVYVLATIRGMETGRLPHENPGRLSTVGTAVVSGGGAGFPAAMRKYLKDHYVPAGDGRLRVAGCPLERRWENGRWVMRADPPVAGDYLVLADGLTPAGLIAVKAAGSQTFDTEVRKKALLYWKSAWDAGFRPPATAASAAVFPPPSP